MANGTFEPLDKPARIVDRKAIERARKAYCEYCFRRGGELEVHHIKSRGAGGDDVGDNLITLCKWTCHKLAQDYKIPRETLLRIAQARDGGR